ncbi:MAG: hypothetical protein K9K79_12030 [Desulfohalobiaceae bacterium]|nr:hypothetical protein [Desulfohalobiaceae bacterium]
MKAFVIVRDFLIFIAGVWFFQLKSGYTFPEGDNLLLYFVAIPIICTNRVWREVCSGYQ